MKILAWDLSTRQGSLALAEDDRLLFERSWTNDRRTSGPFFTQLGELLPASLDLIVVGLGPGSYTGTRIAIAAAVGVALTTGAELGGAPSVGALSEEDAYNVTGDAKRSSFFWVTVREGFVEGQPDLLSSSELTTALSSATLPVYSSDVPQIPVRFPRAALLARHAWRAPAKLARAPLAPIYLREPHITIPRRRE